MQASVPEYYDVLRVQRSASWTELRSAYLQQVLTTHPDKGGNESDFCKVLDAFQILSDPISRAAYDQKLQKQASDKKSQAFQRQQDSTTTTKSKRTLAQNDHCLHVQSAFLPAVWGFLQQLCPGSRRTAIQKLLSESQRLALEKWMKARPSRPVLTSTDSIQHTAMSTSSPGNANDVCESLETANRALHGDTDRDDQDQDAPSRGISRSTQVKSDGSIIVKYDASVCLPIPGKVGLYFYLYARQRRDIGQSVADHIVLTKILHHIRNASSGLFEDRVLAARTQVLQEHGLTAGEGPHQRGTAVPEDEDCLFLRYQLIVHTSYRFDTCYRSPRFTDVLRSESIPQTPCSPR
eukprot:gnl/MRDRNA2_/MRDRNA2_33335_c0_seq1.p1 gnl/MRDRNA2_/MRDRNA2_33335_c0~~gnl/MRDRNA2_/MRDRNA2_33335_c0_seq1.p1  ORF type:complete len:350 (+),score=41.25 gnl/MRDRNA2_/MRDRNA2_33335_c0_seq1:72-1121(+)